MWGITKLHLIMKLKYLSTGTGYIDIYSDGQLTGYVPLRYDNGVFRCDISGNIGLTVELNKVNYIEQTDL